MRGPGVLASMNVYLLYVFDSMASNWGAYELDAVYRNEADALAERDRINARIKAEQPHNKWPSLAMVNVMELK